MSALGFRSAGSIDEMLVTLARHGVGIRPSLALEDVVTEEVRAAVVRNGYESLLCALGGERVVERGDEMMPQFVEEPPASPDVWHFDAECIYDHGDYLRIARHVSELAAGELRLQDAVDHVDVAGRIAWLEFTVAGLKTRCDFKVKDDWVDEAVFDELQDRLVECGSERRIAVHPLGQDMLIICKTAEETAALNRSCRLSFKPIDRKRM